MSKQIDTTKPLSKEDREYMLTRGREDEVARLDAQFAAQSENATLVEEVEPYDKWKMPELQQEAKVRNLEVDPKATKQQLVAVLEEDDRNNPQ